MRATAVKRRKAVLGALLASHPGGLETANLCRATSMRAGRLYPVLAELRRDHRIRAEYIDGRAVYYFVKVKEEDEPTVV